MRYLRWMGLMSSLLIVGAFGELTAPLSSDALSVKIAGSTVQITPTSAACSPGYTLCSFIPPGQYGQWIVEDVSPTNKARVMIGDFSGANQLDLLKVTGIAFTPMVTTGTQTTTVVVTHTYSVGQPKGDYSLGFGFAGYFDPPGTGNIVGDRLQEAASGNFAGTIVTLGSGLDTGVLATPSGPGANGSVTKTKAAAVVRSNCDTGSAKCAPTITQTLTITSKDGDKLVKSDSMIGVFGVCRPVGQVIPIRPDLYALMLKLDPLAPNDITKLSEWLGKMGTKYLKNKTSLALLAFLRLELDNWLAKTVPGTCPEVQAQMNAVVQTDVDKELVAAAAVGAVPAEPGGTITITKNTNHATSDTFTFNIISGESSSTETIPMDGQTSQSIVVTVEPGTYNISEPEISIPSGWSLNNSSCGEEGGSTVGVVVEVGGNVDCTFNNKTFISDDYRVIDNVNLSWSDARAQAQALAQTLGGVWDLADIRSQEEQNFIQTLLPPNPRAIPGIHDYWIAGKQPGGSPEPGGNWLWATDLFVFYTNNIVQPGGYANWGTQSPGPTMGPANEPNDLGNENYATLDNRYGWGWNDLNGDANSPRNAIGYVAKRVSPVTP